MAFAYQKRYPLTVLADDINLAELFPCYENDHIDLKTRSAHHIRVQEQILQDANSSSQVHLDLRAVGVQ